jgi:tRNA threonylcarbamoyl adenosine modification protein YjeE
MNTAEALPSRIQLDLPDEEATERLARRLAVLALPGDVLTLWGDLGVGKTVFARAFVRARGNPFEDVPSPTFTLVQIYEPGGNFRGAVHHFDLFRLRDPDEIYELGIEEAFAGAIALIEWPDRLGRLLPSRRLDVRLQEGPGPNARRVVLEAHGEPYARFLEAELG